ncbi:hypothetical protein ACFRNT_11540 [Streptomyces sp. NPDC056697]|uniref:hypothetical protein n=1 Tax=Streptomyces sp. NPDC056697 TaxID=3345915 RepID=UPI0036905B92
MTKRLADAVERKASTAVKQQSAAWLLATVSAVGTDGTVDITTATGPVQGVRRLRAYRQPQVGDVVKVARNAAGNWVVVGSLAAGDPSWQPLTMASGFSWNGGPTDPFPQCRLTDDGLLQLSGIIKGAATSGATTQIATLPAGVSTSLWIRGVAMTSIVANHAGVGISPAGAVNIYPTTTHTASTWVQLDGVMGRSR